MSDREVIITIFIASFFGTALGRFFFEMANAWLKRRQKQRQDFDPAPRRGLTNYCTCRQCLLKAQFDAESG